MRGRECESWRPRGVVWCVCGCESRQGEGRKGRRTRRERVEARTGDGGMGGEVNQMNGRSRSVGDGEATKRGWRRRSMGAHGMAWEEATLTVARKAQRSRDEEHRRSAAPPEESACQQHTRGSAHGGSVAGLASQTPPIRCRSSGVPLSVLCGWSRGWRMTRSKTTTY